MTIDDPKAVRRFDRVLAAPGLEWRGRLEAVFETAAVARPDGEAPRITLVGPSRDLVPWSAAAPLAGLAVGDAVRLAGRTLEVRGAGGRRAFRLAGRGVRLSMARRAAAASIDRVPAHLAEIAGSGRPGALLGHGACTARHIGDRAASITAWLCCLTSSGGWERAVAGIAGAGPGLTPSGDDVLVGILAAAARLGAAGWVHRGRVLALRRAVAALPRGCTTPVSREMLDHAARGRFPEALLAVAQGIGDPREPAGALGRAGLRLVTGTGATSGADMLAGVVGLARDMVRSVPGAWCVGRSQASSWT